MKFHELTMFTDRFLIDEVCHLCGDTLIYKDDHQNNEIVYSCPREFNWADSDMDIVSHFIAVIRYIRDGSQRGYFSHINYRLIDENNRSIWICNDYKTGTCDVEQLFISMLGGGDPVFEYKNLCSFKGVCPSVPNILQSALDSYLLA